MPVSQICLTCKLPIVFVENQLRRGEGCFYHLNGPPPGFRSHSPVPALDHDDAGQPAFFSNPSSQEETR